MSKIFKIIFVTMLSCSEQQSSEYSKSSGLSTSRAVGESSSSDLLNDFVKRMTVNIIGDEIVELPDHPTVLEKHHATYGQEILKAEGRVLDNYLAWVGCFQGMKYVGTGLFHPVEIGHTIARFAELDPSIPMEIANCASKQPSIERKEVDLQVFNLSGEGKLFFDIYLSRGVSNRMEDALASGTSQKEYSGVKCHTLPLCEAHYAAGLGEGKRCTLLPEALILKSEKYKEDPYLKNRLGDEPKAIFDESRSCPPDQKGLGLH